MPIGTLVIVVGAYKALPISSGLSLQDETLHLVIWSFVVGIQRPYVHHIHVAVTPELGNAAIPNADNSASSRREGNLIAIITCARQRCQDLVHLRDLEGHPPALAIVCRELDGALALVLNPLTGDCNEFLSSPRSFRCLEDGPFEPITGDDKHRAA